MINLAKIQLICYNAKKMNYVTLHFYKCFEDNEFEDYLSQYWKLNFI